MTRQHTDDHILYTATAHNRTGPNGHSWTDGGLRVAVRNPVAPARSTAPTQPSPAPAHPGGDADHAAASPATNPEELVALAWATCLSGSARIIAGGQRKVSVRVDVDLREDEDGPGYAFEPTAYIAFSDATPDEADALAAAAHARCPMSKLLSGRGTATIIAVPYPLAGHPS